MLRTSPAPRSAAGPEDADLAFVRVDAGYGPAAFYRRARYALLEAYRHSGVGPDGVLLAPAYHCRTVLDPALHLGGPVELYELDESLAPRLDRIAARLERRAPAVKAVVVTHFFGFAQPLQALRELCSRHGVALIEDCSHLLIHGTAAQAQAGAPGRTGDWVAASPYKFFACSEGGLLWSSLGHRLETPPGGGSLTRELRRLASGLREGRRYATLPDAAESDAVQMPASGTAQAADADKRVDDAGLSVDFVPADVGVRGAPWARWLMDHADIQRIALARRQNYRRLLDIVRALPNCRPLYERLPEAAAPYAMPLLLHEPQRHFVPLKRFAMQLGRWDDIAASDCSVSRDYRLRLVHLPCHQQLTQQHLLWLAAVLTKVLSS